VHLGQTKVLLDPGHWYMFGVSGSILLERNSSQSIRNLGQTKVLFRPSQDIGAPWSDQGIVSINSGQW